MLKRELAVAVCDFGWHCSFETDVRAYRLGLNAYFLALAALPFANLLARRAGTGTTFSVSLVLIFITLMGVFYKVSFNASFVMLNESITQKNSLGTLNGLSQTGCSLARAIAPALSTSLFSFSVKKQILGGNMVYLALALFVLGIKIFSWQLEEGAGPISLPLDESEADDA
jgi:hypothetical protein